MQIHELTKLQTQLEEGLLDGVKAAIQTVKTGASNGGGLTGVGKALVSPRAYQQAKNDVLKKQGNKDLAAIQKKMNAGKKEGDAGYWIAPGQKGYDAQQAAKAVASNPQAQQKINNLTAQFQDTFGVYDPATGQHSQTDTVLPEPNQTLMVTTKNGGKYYKAINGNWYSETGEVVPNPTELEKMVSADQYKQVGVPGVIQTKLKITAPEVKPTSTVKSNAIKEGSSNARRQRRLAAGITQPNSTTKKLALKDFDQWALKNIPDIKTAEQNPEAKTEIHNLATQIKASTDVEKATPLFKKLMTTVVSATGGQGATSGTSGTRNGKGMPAADFIGLIKQHGVDAMVKQLKNDPPARPSGSDTLDNFLKAERLLAEELKAFKADK